ncbi:non-ribosomal peptide synthetase [Embleya sp. NPDC055664]
MVTPADEPPVPDRIPLSPARQDILVAAALDGSVRGLARQIRLTLADTTTADVAHAWAELMRLRPELAVGVDWSQARPTLVRTGVALPFRRTEDTPTAPDGATCDGTSPDRAAHERAAVEELRRGFPPELDTALGRLLWSDTTHEAVFTYHPLLVDDLGAHLLLSDLAALLRGERPVDRPNDRPVRPDSAEQAEATAFWRRSLADVDGATPLFPEPAARAGREPGTVRVTLSAPATDAVRELAATANSCKLRVVAAAWASVVARFRGESLAVIGLSVDTRPPALRACLSPFERTLPTPVRLDDTPAAAWIAALSRWMEQARAYGRLPGAVLHELSGAERGVALYDSVVDARDDAAVPAPEAAGPPLAVGVEDDGATLTLVARYAPEVADAERVERLLRCTAAVLTGAAATPDTPMSRLPLIDAAEAAALNAHNDTAVDHPRDRCLHQHVEDQVDRTPDRPALVHEGAAMSYAELDLAANRLAHHLIDLGVRPDTIVGLCSEPGFELNVAILAILKAGGAYAPLDPSFPPDRLHYLARDLDCEVVLVSRRFVELLPKPRHLVVLDEPEAWADRPGDRPDTGVAPDNLAYVMYTSGSTGRPKGVLVQHGGAVNFVWWISRLYELQAEEAALQWTAYSFDAAVWELFWPLFVGARAVLAPPRLHLDLDRFTELIRTERVATLHFVPAMLQTFLTAEEAGSCTSLRFVFASGEPIPPTLAERFHKTLDADLINLYGVTEVSIDTTFHVLPREVGLPFVPSGRPMNNETTYVLDRHLEPVPFGARGEVYIGGESVTRGYHGRPGLTADRFVPDPFAGGGARLYRTGDVATLLPDGNLHFLGRSDHQVKVRGIRIEPHEVEAEIAEHPEVRECLVVPWGDGSERSLAAYVVPRGDDLDVAGLRTFLAARMPGYMVPTSIATLSAFPLGHTGKIDRKALPAPRGVIDERLTDGVAPRTDTEHEVARIWQEVLRVPSVGVLDDFFAVGGNSLLATRVIAAVRSRFGVRLPLRTWLESSAVADLAAAIDRCRDEEESVAALVAEVAGLPEDEVREPGR